MNAKIRLINISTALFALHGYDAVGIKEIVDKAGVTKPTLYHHFGNKEGLLKAALMPSVYYGSEWQLEGKKDRPDDWHLRPTKKCSPS